MPHCVGLLCVWGALGVAGASQAQQICNAGVALSSPNTRFTGDSDGNTTDATTQLMWMRCPLGQTWAGEGCQGMATRMDWNEGSAIAQRINASGAHFYNDWRLPSLRELASVAERQCTQPRINLAVFPATPAAAFWTSTPSLKLPDQAYALDFAAGGVAPSAHASKLHVRLVRTAP